MRNTSPVLGDFRSDGMEGINAHEPLSVDKAKKEGPFWKLIDFIAFHCTWRVINAPREHESDECVMGKDVNESDPRVFQRLYFLIYSMSFTLKIMKKKGFQELFSLFVIKSSEQCYLDYFE